MIDCDRCNDVLPARDARKVLTWRLCPTCIEDLRAFVEGDTMLVPSADYDAPQMCQGPLHELGADGVVRDAPRLGTPCDRHAVEKAAGLDLCFSCARLHRQIASAFVHASQAVVEQLNAGMRSTVAAMKGDTLDDDDGPESVPEGAEGKGPGWSVTAIDPDDHAGQGGAAGTLYDGEATTGLGAPPSTAELLEALRSRRAIAQARLNHRKLCDGPLHIADALHSCPHFGWVKRADHDLCLACAQAYDQLMARPPVRADVCMCGHLRALHALSEVGAVGWMRCTCTLDGGAPCDCLEFRPERRDTATTW